MTKKLEELLDMAPAKEVSENTDIIPEPEKTVSHIQEHTPEDIQRAIAKADKIDEALPMVKDLSLNDQEMDEIATTAKDTFQDLMDLGMNVESRYAGEIFNTAARLLDTALNAKGAKVDRKLKMIQLQLQKARLDQVQAKHDKESGVQEEGDAVILDRNALLEKLLSKDK
jgi:diadenosine tetraphosphate (Ap4A) HIT family hydrolase